VLGPAAAPNARRAQDVCERKYRDILANESKRESVTRLIRHLVDETRRKTLALLRIPQQRSDDAHPAWLGKPSSDPLKRQRVSYAIDTHRTRDDVQDSRSRDAADFLRRLKAGVHFDLPGPDKIHMA